MVVGLCADAHLVDGFGLRACSSSRHLLGGMREVASSVGGVAHPPRHSQRPLGRITCLVASSVLLSASC